MTEKLKSYQTLLNVKDSQKVFADVNSKIIKKWDVKFSLKYSNIFAYSNIFEYSSILKYSNIFKYFNY